MAERKIVMMLTVLMTDSQESVTLNRLLKLLIATNAGSYSVEDTPSPWLGVEIT